MTTQTDAESGKSFDDLIEQALLHLPKEAQQLTAQAIQAARSAHETHHGFLGGLVNMRKLESEDGRAVLMMDVTPNALNGYGYVHGGMLFTLADYAMGYASSMLVAPGENVVTLEAKANYISNLKEGRAVAKVETLHKGSHLITLETRIYNAETDELLMIVTGTFYIIATEHASEPPRAHGRS